MEQKTIFIGLIYIILVFLCNAKEIQTRTTNNGRSRSLVANDAEWINIKDANCGITSSSYALVFALSTTEALDLFDFNFSIPEDAIITGITANWTVSLDEAPIGGCRESSVSIFTNTSEYFTTPNTNWTWEAIPNQVISYPLANDDPLWGKNGNWTAQEINDFGFGVSLIASNGAENVIVVVECCYITVTYHCDGRCSTFTNEVDSNTDITKTSSATTTVNTTTITSMSMSNTNLYITSSKTQSEHTLTHGNNSPSLASDSSNSFEIRESTNDSWYSFILSDYIFEYLIFIMVCFMLLILFISTFFMYYRYQCKKTRGIRHRDLENIKELSILTNGNAPKELWLSNIEMRRQLGMGNFGIVFLGEWNGTTQVACKTIKRKVGNESIEDEARILQSLKHPNIVTYFGLYNDSDYTYMVTEYLPKGSLLDFIRNNFPPEENLITLSISASSGASYLQTRNVIHRDLAARNLLVTEIDSNFSIKIADVGLSRFVGAGKNYVSKHSNTAPIRWSAPEVLDHRVYSIKSDVWSFGVVLWEIFSYGNIPYGKETDNLEIYKGIVEGSLMLDKPDACPEPIYAIMKKCLDNERDERPDFSEIHQALIVYNSESGHSNVMEEIPLTTDEYEYREPKKPWHLDKDTNNHGSFYTTD
jgi:serine/threonine protein kinase